MGYLFYFSPKWKSSVEESSCSEVTKLQETKGRVEVKFTVDLNEQKNGMITAIDGCH